MSRPRSWPSRQVSADARTRMPTARALVAAEIAYAENDGARAIRELDQIAVPTAADQAQNYWWIRGRSAFMTGHPVEGTRALVERERWLTDPAALRANRAELLSSDSDRRGTRPAAETAAQDRSHRRRLAGFGTRRGRARPRSHARIRSGGQLEAPVSAASGERQCADHGIDPDRRRHGISRPDRAAAAAVGPRRVRRASRCATASLPPTWNRIRRPARA